jgi:CheY-like chemotaxis protein
MNERVPVLLVDDNPTKRLALRAALLPLGYTIVEAGSGREALRCVMTQDFAVILLDVCMPVMDGFETAALIRKRPRSELTPIIFITALSSDEVSNTDLYSAGVVLFECLAGRTPFAGATGGVSGASLAGGRAGDGVFLPMQ